MSPVRVLNNGVTRHNVEGERLRVQRCRRGDEDTLVHVVREANRPLQSLHTTKAAPDDGGNAAEAKLTQERAMNRDDVAHRDFGEGRTVGFARRRIDGRGACRAGAPAQDIRANHAKTVGINP